VPDRSEVSQRERQGGACERLAEAHLDVADPPARAAASHALRADRQPRVPAASRRALRAGLRKGGICLVPDVSCAIGPAAFRLVASVGLACDKERDPGILPPEPADQRVCPRSAGGARSRRKASPQPTVVAAREIRSMRSLSQVAPVRLLRTAAVQVARSWEWLPSGTRRWALVFQVNSAVTRNTFFGLCQVHRPSSPRA